MTTEPAALAIRWDHLNRILDQYGHGDHDFDLDHRCRFLLVEQSTYNGSYTFSLHPSPSSAFDYQSNQECAEDWEPQVLIDLDTLLSMSLFRTFGVEVESVHKFLLLENLENI